MKNNWSNSGAKKYIRKYKNLGYSKDLALRVYTTRLLGRNNELVLHGGGNTSVKTILKEKTILNKSNTEKNSAEKKQH